MWYFGQKQKANEISKDLVYTGGGIPYTVSSWSLSPVLQMFTILEFLGFHCDLGIFCAPVLFWHAKVKRKKKRKKSFGNVVCRSAKKPQDCWTWYLNLGSKVFPQESGGGDHQQNIRCLTEHINTLWFKQCFVSILMYWKGIAIGQVKSNFLGF